MCRLRSEKYHLLISFTYIILTGINGQTFNTLEEALQTYQTLQSEPVLHLEIERHQHREIFRDEIR
jgi:hypothetical protein